MAEPDELLSEHTNSWLTTITTQKDPRSPCLSTHIRLLAQNALNLTHTHSTSPLPSLLLRNISVGEKVSRQHLSLTTPPHTHTRDGHLLQAPGEEGGSKGQDSSSCRTNQAERKVHSHPQTRCSRCHGFCTCTVEGRGPREDSRPEP